MYQPIQYKKVKLTGRGEHFTYTSTLRPTLMANLGLKAMVVQQDNFFNYRNPTYNVPYSYFLPI